jgi:carboxypeptidase family protein
VTFPASSRWTLSLSILLVLCSPTLAAAQADAVPQTGMLGRNYRIAGTVVNKTDGHPLARARIVVRDTKDPKRFESLVTAEDGMFAFTDVPAGKYSLSGTKRGYISAAYDQHDQFSTAIVTGAGLDTEALVLRLAPDAVIAGKVLDESGEPVRQASVAAYYDDHSSGVDQIRQIGGAQTDDQGAYEIRSLTPGTYFLSANAKPWYALHPRSNPSSGQDSEIGDAANFDRSLDVAYPLTYYPDVTDADSAMPIPIRGGERLQVEIHLNPVPALHLLFRVPQTGNNGFTVPQLEQPSFDGSTFLQSDGVQLVSPGLVEMTGVPAGRYNLRFNEPGSTMQMNAVDLTKDGQEIDISGSEAISNVKVSAKVTGETSLPSRLSVGLRSAHRRPVGWKELDAKGEAELEQIPAGRYDVLVWGASKPYSIAHMSAEGATVSGRRTITVTAGSSASVSLTLVGGSSNIEGIAKRAGKPFAGAMVVLVPKDPETNRDQFRRDQSDLDGTFSLRNVIPGTYTLLAIENGWDLDWSEPGVIAVYVKHGQNIVVSNQMDRTINLTDAVEVQSK